MRAYEKVRIEVKPDQSNPDFGNRAAGDWIEAWTGHASINDKSGRLVQSGQQMQPIYDEEITIRYHRPLHEMWQKNKVLRVIDVAGDKYGVKSLKHIRGTRVEWLKLGCVRT